MTNFQLAARLTLVSTQNVQNAATEMDLFNKGFRATFPTAIGPILYSGTQFLRKKKKKKKRFDVKRYLGVFLTSGRLMLNLGRCPAPAPISPQ